MKEMVRTRQGERVWCPLYLRPCCVCVRSVKVENAGRDFIMQRYDSALVLLITSRQLGAEAFFFSHSGTLLFPLPPSPGKPVSTTTMAAVVKDFSELLCYGWVKGRAAGKAQHQQAGFYGFKSQRWRDIWLSWEGRQEITSDKGAGRMEVGWFREQCYPPACPEIAHWLLWVAPPPQTHSPSLLHHTVERLRWCQEKINRSKLIRPFASA